MKTTPARPAAGLLALGALAAAATAQTTLVGDRFDTGADGWLARDVPAGELCNAPGPGLAMISEHVGSGGHPGGFFRVEEAGVIGIDPLLRSGPSFAGDFSAAYGGFLRYDRRMDLTGAQGDVADVYLQATVRGVPVTLVADTPGYPVTSWKASRVPLLSGVWRVGGCTGPLASEAEILDVLSNLTRVLLRGEYRSGAEVQDVDNVMIVTAGTGPQSTFETDADGWTVAGDAAVAWDDVIWAHPQCLLAVDQVTGVGYEFAAPAKFLGDQSAASGLTLELDLWASPTAAQTFPSGGAEGFVRIRGAGLALSYERHVGAQGEQPITGSRWRHHAVPLGPSPAWTREADGAIATPADFDAVLAAVTELRIRGEYRTGAESERLDNVVLGSCAPSAVVTIAGAFQANVSTCPAEPAVFFAGVSGAGPVTFQWQIESPADSVAWADLSADGIFSEAATGLEAEISGTGTDALTLSGIELGRHPQTLRVRVIVSNACGSYTSASAAAILVAAPADVNGDGVVNVDDLVDLIIAWGVCPGCPEDVDGNGVVEVDDLVALILSWGSCEP